MHCHTKEGSIDAKVPIQEYITKLVKEGFDGMLVTDHNSYDGYRKFEKIAKNLHLENFIYKKINESFSDIIAAIQKILFASLEQRLAGFLLDESGGSEDGKIYMTQEQIAKAIGSAREAVSRTLKVLVKEGCVELFRGGVAVLDRKQLYRKL